MVDGMTGFLPAACMILFFTLMLMLTSPTGAMAQEESGFGIRFDLGPGMSVMDERFYADARWSDGALVDVQEYWRFRFDGNSGISPGAAFLFRFNQFVSLELEGRGLWTRPRVSTDYDVYWRWDDGRSEWNAYRGYQFKEPELQTFVGSLNLTFHLTDQGPIRPFVTFGGSLFDTEVRGVHDTAYAYTYTAGPLQYLDFEYPLVRFEGDARTAGFNAGIGGDFHFQQNMAITFMLKYYYASTEEARLVVQGNYPELNNFTYEVDPSFWLATAGIKFFF